nr:hypothetical protein OG781_18315 [Streptomyces sp. NBC_00830]
MLQDIDLKYVNGVLTTSKNIHTTGSLSVDGSFTLGGTTSSAYPPVPVPSDHGLLGWSYDPSFALSALTPTLGTVYLSAVYIRQATTISKLWFMLGTAATTPTSGQNWIGLVNSSGTILSTASLDSVITGSNAPKSATLSAAQAVAPGTYWVALLFNAAAAPVIYKTAMPFTGFGVVNQATVAFRYATAGTSQTTLSAITVSSNVAGQSIWVAAS